MSKIVLLTTTVSPASGGFGMYQRGEPWVYPLDYSRNSPEAQWNSVGEAVDAYLSESADCGGEIEKTDEIDGMIYDQNGADIYKITWDADNIGYFALWTEEVENEN